MEKNIEGGERRTILLSLIFASPFASITSVGVIDGKIFVESSLSSSSADIYDIFYSPFDFRIEAALVTIVHLSMNTSFFR